MTDAKATNAARRPRPVLRCFTLCELLAACFLLLVVTASALMISQDIWQHVRQNIRNAMLVHEADLLRKAWRTHVNACPSNLLIGAAADDAGGWRAEIAGRDLVLTSPGKARRFVLPRGMEADLDALEGDCAGAVLTLRWTTARTAHHSMRVVACSGLTGVRQ